MEKDERVRLQGAQTNAAQQEERPIKPGVHTTIPPKTCVAIAIVVVVLVSLLLGQPHFDTSETPRPDWQGSLVSIVIVVAVMLMIHNFHAAFCMIGINLIFIVTGIIKPREFFLGFASEAVIATGTLCVFADAVYQSAILDVIMGPFLPAKAPLWEARLRIMLLGFCFSSFLNNTPVMAILLPVTEAYAARAGYPLRSLLMPLSFAIFLGGNNSLIGSSSNLTTLAAASEIVPGYGTSWAVPNFFSPALVGFPVGIAGLLFMTAFTTVFLPSFQGQKPSTDDEDTAEDEIIPDAKECLAVPGQPLLSNSYTYLVALRPIHPLIGQPVWTTGLSKADPTITLKRVMYHSETGPAAHTNKKDWADHVLAEKDLLVFRCTAQGVAQIRKRRGLKLCNDNVAAMGPGRRRRVLVEAVVGRGSDWRGKTVTSQTIQAAFKERAAVVAVRQVETQTDIVERKEEKSSLLVYDSDTDTGTDDDTPAGSASRAFKVQAGCLLLLEAYSDFPSTCPKHQCPMVSAVPKSKPPRWYSTKDKVRMLVVAAVLCAVIFSAAANILPLSVSGFCAIFAMVFLKIITPQEAIKSVEPSTLLIISSSAGVGKAIQHTGLGEWLGERFVEMSMHTFIGLLLWFYIMLSVLGCFLNNNAQIVLVMPIAYSASLKAGVGFRPFLYLCMYMASVSSFNIPIARAVNLMIVNRAPYTFADFALFGPVLQLFLMPIMLYLLWQFEVFDLWSYFNAVCDPFGSLC